MMKPCRVGRTVGSLSCYSRCTIELPLLMVILTVSHVICSGKGVQGLHFPAPDFKNCNNSQGCCPTPYNGTIKNYVFDTKLPMRTRRPAHLLDDAYIAKYEKAYRLLRALPDSDPRSWKNQAMLHCAYCDGAFYYPTTNSRLEIHFGWFFFPWHRFFIYFHERILAKLLGDDTFALPFWNWDNQSPDSPFANVLPYTFANAMYKNKNSSLYDIKRNTCAQPPNIIDMRLLYECANQTVELKTLLRAVNSRLMYTQLVTGAPIGRLLFGESNRFGDTAGIGSGTVEQAPHGPVHVWTGDPKRNFSDMGVFRYAAYDPVFYAHHGNIDRLSEVWKTLPGGNRKDLDHPDFLNAEFLFYDENGSLVKVKVSEALNVTPLRYQYEEVPNHWVHEGSDAVAPSCFPASKSELETIILNTPTLNPNTFTNFTNSTITFSVRRPVKKLHDREEVLVIATINLDPYINSIKFRVDVFLYYPTANVNSTITCREYLGTLCNILCDFSPDLPVSKKQWRLAIGHKLRTLGMDGFDHVIVTLVQVKLPVNIQFKDVLIEQVR